MRFGIFVEVSSKILLFDLANNTIHIDLTRGLFLLLRIFVPCGIFSKKFEFFKDTKIKQYTFCSQTVKSTQKSIKIFISFFMEVSVSFKN